MEKVQNLLNFESLKGLYLAEMACQYTSDPSFGFQIACCFTFS